MASPEASYTATSSVVSTKPRTREEVREELREELRLLEMPRLSPEEKERLERQAVEGAEGEVELFERSWRKTQPDSLGDIERKVDALGTTPPLPPSVQQPGPGQSPLMTPGYGQAPAPLPPRSSTPDLTPAPPHTVGRTRPLGARLSPTEQRAIGKHLGGQLLRTDVLFTTSRGRVVECEYKKGGQQLKTTVVIAEGDEVATLDEIGARLDKMSLPSAPAPPPSGLEAALGPGGPPSPTPRPATVRKVEAGPTGRTPMGLTPTVANQVIENIEGIGEAYGQQLRAQGVEIIEDLLERDPAQLAKASGINETLVAKWQDMGRLQAVNGIGPQYSELLVRAGVRTMKDLAAQDPAALAAKLNEYEASLGVRVQGTAISPSQTADWVQQAKELTASAATAAPAKPAAAKPAAKPAPAKKGLSLSLGKKKAEEPAAAPPPEEGAAGGEPPKKKFGLKFGRK